MQYLVEVHARPLRRSCACIGLSRSAWYAPPLDWTVRDAELIAALARLVEDKPSRGFWKCCQILARTHPEWNEKRIYRVYCAMRLNLRRAAARRLPKRERMLYDPKARKAGSVQVLEPAPDPEAGKFMEFMTSAMQRPVRMQRRTIEYGAHIPTLVKLLDSGYFEQTGTDDAP